MTENYMISFSYSTSTSRVRWS